MQPSGSLGLAFVAVAIFSLGCARNSRERSPVHMQLSDPERAVCGMERSMRVLEAGKQRKAIAADLQRAKRDGYGRDRALAESASDPVERFVTALHACWFSCPVETQELCELRKRPAFEAAVAQTKAATAAGDHRKAASLLQVAAGIERTPEVDAMLGGAMAADKREASLARLSAAVIDLENAQQGMARAARLTNDLRATLGERERAIDALLEEARRTHDNDGTAKWDAQRAQLATIRAGIEELASLTLALVSELGTIRARVVEIVREVQRTGSSAVDRAKTQDVEALRGRVRSDLEKLREAFDRGVQLRVTRASDILRTWSEKTDDGAMRAALANAIVVVPITATAGTADLSHVLIETPREVVLGLFDALLVSEPARLAAVASVRALACHEYLAEQELALITQDPIVATQGEAERREAECMAFWGRQSERDQAAALGGPPLPPPRTGGYPPWRTSFNESYSHIAVLRSRVEPTLPDGVARGPGNETAVSMRLGGMKVWRPRDWKLLPWFDLGVDIGTTEWTSDPPEGGESMRFGGLEGALGVDLRIVPWDGHRLNLAAGPLVGGHLHGFTEHDGPSYGYDLGGRVRGMWESKAGQTPHLFGEVRLIRRQDKEANAVYGQLEAGFGFSRVALFGVIGDRWSATGPNDLTIKAGDRVPFAAFFGGGIRVYSKEE
jgi:hypothetical protein